jgi:TolB-like protein/DNA-binding winged helix-turn-helix (wHTH) protein/Tfp pilus assembly protein PilF
VASPVQQAKVVRFGPFEFDLRTHWLTRGGEPERLSLQPLRLLGLLVQRRGELVSREELRTQLWPGETFVDFDHGLNNAVNRVREALRDSATAPRYIETVPRRGYRFIAEVKDFELPQPEEAKETIFSPPDLPEQAESRNEVPGVAATVAAKAITEPEKAQSTPHTSSVRRRLMWLKPLLAGTLALVALVFYLKPARMHPAGPIRSLAVLPLQNLSGDPNEEYFVDGMTDALITELARIPKLRVVSRTSAMQDKGSKKSLRQIASELDVDAVVEGSVVRSGDHVRITAQLIDTRDDRHLWAESFEEPIKDVLALQDEVVNEIASEAEAALAPLRESTGSARVNPAAYDAYLRGLYFLHLRDALKSVAYFKQAISLDPSYPGSYAGLAEALASDQVLSNTKPSDTGSLALAAAKRGISLDSESGEAYSALGFVEFIYSRDWNAAGQDLQRGVALSPNNSLAELQYSVYLDATGRPEDAVTHMRRAVRLDPLSFLMNRHLGSVLYFARRYDEALVYLRRAAELDPHNFPLVENWRSRTFEMLGRTGEAEAADLLMVGAWFPDAHLAPLRLAYERGGWKGYQTARIELLLHKPLHACGSFEIGESYLRLGDREKAFSWLSRGVETSCFWVNSLAVDPVLEDLRGDPRYLTLLQKVHTSRSG